MVAGIHFVVFASFPSENGEGCHDDAFLYVPSLYVFWGIIRPLYGTSHEDDVPLNHMSDPALHRKNTENSKQIFRGKELRGYCLNSYIHVSALSDLYISMSDLPVLLQENRWAECGNMYSRSLADA